MLPQEVLKAIDNMVAAKMREQFPIKKFSVSKKQLINTKTWSSRDLKKINLTSDGSFHMS